MMVLTYDIALIVSIVCCKSLFYTADKCAHVHAWRTIGIYNKNSLALKPNGIVLNAMFAHQSKPLWHNFCFVLLEIVQAKNSLKYNLYLFSF